MDAAAIIAIFADVTPVRVRRMFGGHGVYSGETMFALEAGGELYLKANAESAGRFQAAGSAPFAYERAGRTTTMSYWRLPEAAWDDPDSLREWTALALAAAARSAGKVTRRGSPRPPRPRPR